MRLVIARPARWSDVGVVEEMRSEVSWSSDWSSWFKRESWVRAKEGISIAPLGDMMSVLGDVDRRIRCLWFF